MVIIIYAVKAGTQASIPAEDMSPNGNIYLSYLKQVVVLTVAAIPVGLPTVLSVTMVSLTVIPCYCDQSKLMGGVFSPPLSDLGCRSQAT
jgi:hypothetical protein